MITIYNMYSINFFIISNVHFMDPGTQKNSYIFS